MIHRSKLVCGKTARLLVLVLASCASKVPAEVAAGDAAPADAGTDPSVDAGTDASGVPKADGGVPIPVDAGAWRPAPWTPPADARPSAACGTGALPPADGYQDITSNGQARRFITHLPASYDGTKTFPVIVVFHSLGEDAHQFEKTKFNFPALAQETAVLVQMEALPITGGRQSFGSDTPEDVAYTNATIAWLKTAVCVDVSRIYAVGQSEGATFADYLGCQEPDVFRAVAANVPHLIDMSACKGPIPTWFSYGTLQSSFLVTQQEQMLASWLKLDGCNAATATPTAFPPCVRYTCSANRVMQSCAYPGEHPWPDFASPAVFQFFLSF